MIAAKDAVNHAQELGLSAGLDYERRLFTTLFATADQKEGMAAFVEKRPPVWRPPLASAPLRQAAASSGEGGPDDDDDTSCRPGRRTVNGPAETPGASPIASLSAAVSEVGA